MDGSLEKRQLPKLMACMTKSSLMNFRNTALFKFDILDKKALQRHKFPLYECLIKELHNDGHSESSKYLQDLIYDNLQLMAEDDIGIVVDLRKRNDYLEHICCYLRKVEKWKDRGEKKKECLELLYLAMHYAEEGKGILWLAEKFYLASIAVSSQYLLDGGRQKACCKYHYAKFLLDKFPGDDLEESFTILTEVRESAIGKDWPLYRDCEIEDGNEVPPDTVFAAAASELHKVLLYQARAVQEQDPGKAECLSRLAERRAEDTNVRNKTAEAVTEIGICQLAQNNLNNAQKTFQKAYKIHLDSNNIEGMCETKMHLAAVMQRLGKYENAAKLLTEMGALAMKHNLRSQLGQALHLLGELHLRRERPELGTQHLTEAFFCFMGMALQEDPKTWLKLGEGNTEGGFIYQEKENEIYEEEAEQSRLMMAISAGQENMASYFNVIREAGVCSIAKMKIMEWKLSRARWWVTRGYHNFLPCLCPEHNRTPLDVLRMKLDSQLLEEKVPAEFSEGRTSFLQRISTTENIQSLRSNYQQDRNSRRDSHQDRNSQNNMAATG